MKRSVCFITPHFFPRLGGVETHVKEVTAELQKKGWEVTIITLQESAEDSLNEEVHKARVVRIPLTSQKSKLSVWNWIRQQKIFSNPSMIFQVHDVGWWLVPVIPQIKDRLFVTFHGWEGNYPVRWQAKLHRLLLSAACKGSIHVGDFIQKFYWDKPTYVTYGGVKPYTYTEHPKVDIKRPRIAFLGRLEPENAVELYIRVLTELSKQGINPVVKWIGDGSLRKQCEVWGTVTGTVSMPIEELQEADVVFANSYLSILEAQASGKLVCSIYQHPLKKAYITLFPGSEWVLHSDNPADLAEQIKVTLNSPKKLVDTAKNAANFAHSQTWQKVAELYERLWKK